MAGLVPAIHVLIVSALQRRGCPASQTSLRSLRKQTAKAGHDELKTELPLQIERGPSHFLTLLASILIEVSSSLVENALSTANGFSMPR